MSDVLNVDGVEYVSWNDCANVLMGKILPSFVVEG